MRARRLDLRIDTDPDDPERVAVTVLADGADLLDGVGGLRGFDPDELLGTDRPLLPTVPARRVGVALCRCGVAGCRTAAVVVAQHGDVVTWSDARTFVGVYAAPVHHAGSPPGGTAIALPDVVLDAAQYRAEVGRAGADRSWESPRRRVARLVRDRLRSDPAGLARRGWTLVDVWPSRTDPAALGVRLQSVGEPERCTALRVVVDPRDATGRTVDAVVEHLTLAPQEHWAVVRRP